MGIKISIAICTHNRANYLSRAISSALSQSLSPHEFEIVVVDNCSTDETKDVIHQFADDRIQYVFEPSLGLSHARNTGWNHARGKYIAYLDDDAIASSHWLQEILISFETGSALQKIGCVGGKTEGIWEASRPSWISDSLVTCLTVIDWSEESKEITDLSQEWLVGANIAFPRKALEEIGGFTSGMDRIGEKLLSSGDVFLQKQLKKAGYSCYYNPRVLVGHHIQASRLTQKWFVSRYFWQGVSDAMMEIVEMNPSKFRRTSSALARFLKIVASPKKLALLAFPHETPQAFAKKCFTLIEVGHIYGLISL